MRFVIAMVLVGLGTVPEAAEFQSPDAKVKAFNEAVRDPMAVIRPHCRSEWPADFQMQRYCIDQQTEGVNDLAKLFESTSGNDELFAAFTQCVIDWTSVRADGQTDVDFQMIAYCSEQQAEAYRQLTR